LPILIDLSLCNRWHPHSIGREKSASHRREHLGAVEGPVLRSKRRRPGRSILAASTDCGSPRSVQAVCVIPPEAVDSTESLLLWEAAVIRSTLRRWAITVRRMFLFIPIPLAQDDAITFASPPKETLTRPSLEVTVLVHIEKNPQSGHIIPREHGACLRSFAQKRAGDRSRWWA